MTSDARCGGTVEFTPLHGSLSDVTDHESDDDYEIPPPLSCSPSRVCRLVFVVSFILALFIGARFLYILNKTQDKDNCDCDEPCLDDFTIDCENSFSLWPEYCGVFDVNADEAAAITRHWGPGFEFYSSQNCFAYHEVTKHGTCTGYSSAVNYLQAARNAWLSISYYVEHLSQYRGSVVSKDTLYSTLGSRRNVTFSCDIDCVLVDIFFCFSAQNAMLQEPTACPQAVTNQAYTGACSHCDFIDLTNKSHGKLPSSSDRIPRAQGIQIRHSLPPDFNLFLLALFWRHEDKFNSPNEKRLFVHGLWPEFSTLRNASSLASC